MKCSVAKRNIAAYLENAVSEQERRELGSHLRACRSCTDVCERHLRLRAAVRSLPTRQAPKELSVRLRVMASQEFNLRIGVTHTWFERFRFRTNELLRPLAVPLTGGFVAAVLLFAALAPSFAHARAASATDVPCVLFTQPSLESVGPIGFTPADAVVDLRIDQQGRIVNYSIVESTGHIDAVHRSIENSLLFTRFKPATLAPNSCPDCGVSTSGTIRLQLRSSHIEVKG
jgi:hypothetical protein